MYLTAGAIVALMGPILLIMIFAAWITRHVVLGVSAID
jgi:hypothetical protein